MLFDLLLFVVGLIAGGIAAVVGFGIGSFLTPVLALRTGFGVAVATEVARLQTATDKAKAAADAVTVSQKNALNKAKDYMSYSSFSRGGLIDQLKYDKFTPDQATYGVNTVGL
jgi:hypothetical protein